MSTYEIPRQFSMTHTKLTLSKTNQISYPPTPLFSYDTSPPTYLSHLFLLLFSPPKPPNTQNQTDLFLSF